MTIPGVWGPSDR